MRTVRSSSRHDSTAPQPRYSPSTSGENSSLMRRRNKVSASAAISRITGSCSPLVSRSKAATDRRLCGVEVAHSGNASSSFCRVRRSRHAVRSPRFGRRRAAVERLFFVLFATPIDVGGHIAGKVGCKHRIDETALAAQDVQQALPQPRAFPFQRLQPCAHDPLLLVALEPADLHAAITDRFLGARHRIAVRTIRSSQTESGCQTMQRTEFALDPGIECALADLYRVVPHLWNITFAKCPGLNQETGDGRVRRRQPTRHDSTG